MPAPSGGRLFAGGVAMVIESRLLQCLGGNRRPHSLADYLGPYPPGLAWSSCLGAGNLQTRLDPCTVSSLTQPCPAVPCCALSATTPWTSCRARLGVGAGTPGTCRYGVNKVLLRRTQRSAGTETAVGRRSALLLGPVHLRPVHGMRFAEQPLIWHCHRKEAGTRQSGLLRQKAM